MMAESAENAGLPSWLSKKAPYFQYKPAHPNMKVSLSGGKNKNEVMTKLFMGFVDWFWSKKDEAWFGQWECWNTKCNKKKIYMMANRGYTNGKHHLISNSCIILET